MRCSDCKLWKTEDCRNNPGEKDLDYAETFACFDLREGYVLPADMQVDDIDYRNEARKAGSRALVTLIIGFVLITIPPPLAFIGFSPDSSTAAFVASLGIACIAGLSSLILLLAALVFFLQYVGLKGRIKNPVRKETGEADEPKYRGS